MLARCAAAGSVLFALGLVAVAGITSASHTAPAKLTPAEQKALRVVSVRAIGADGLGVTVAVTFAGNLERALGQGNLKTALVAVLLRPKQQGARVRGIAARGAGAVGETHVRAGSGGGGVVRDGRRLFFYFAGARVSGVRTVDVKAFAIPPTSGKRSLQQAKPVSAATWDYVIGQVAYDEAHAAAVDAGLDSASCAQLESWLNGLDFYVKRSRELGEVFRDLRKDVNAAIREVKPKAQSGAKKVAAFALQKILSPFGAAYKAATGQWPLDAVESWKDALRGLELDLRLIDELEGRNERLYESLVKLKGKLELLIKQKCKEPPAKPPALPQPVLYIHSEFSQSRFSTDYTVVVTSGLPGTIVSHWKLTPPPNDPRCDNRGQVQVSAAPMFTWYHGDDVCNHAVEVAGVGHIGVVEVEVVHRSWFCFARIAGTVTGDGNPADTRCDRRN